jgi:TRAP-type mannitol/chloroaromatic compound transport system permease small subunit
MSSVAGSAHGESAHPSGLWRTLGWISVGITLIFVLNNFMTNWLGFPGAFSALSALGILSEKTAQPAEGGDLALGLIQCAMFLGVLVVSAMAVQRSPDRTLRQDALTMSAIVNYIIRAAFWSVLLIGTVDAVISFLRVENLLASVVGEELATELGRSRFRGPYVHLPLMLLSFGIAAVSRKALGFHWLALLVVISELFIVLSRFVFSYEQAFQGDLVRFWYGALFLFASAYTLFEDGHVRVDVLYAGFSEKGKGMVNLVGSITLGFLLSWTILVYAMWDRSSTINSAILAFEVSQSGFGMYVKYWMAGFLAIFAVTMNIQFTSLALESIANIRGEPGRRKTAGTPDH